MMVKKKVVIFHAKRNAMNDLEDFGRRRTLFLMEGSDNAEQRGLRLFEKSDAFRMALSVLRCDG